MDLEGEDWHGVTLTPRHDDGDSSSPFRSAGEGCPSPTVAETSLDDIENGSASRGEESWLSATDSSRSYSLEIPDCLLEPLRIRLQFPSGSKNAKIDHIRQSTLEIESGGQEAGANRRDLNILARASLLNFYCQQTVDDANSFPWFGCSQEENTKCNSYVDACNVMQGLFDCVHQERDGSDSVTEFQFHWPEDGTDEDHFTDIQEEKRRRRKDIIMFISMLVIGIVVSLVAAFAIGNLEPSETLRTSGELEGDSTFQKYVSLRLPDRTALEFRMVIGSPEDELTGAVLDNESFERWLGGEEVTVLWSEVFPPTADDVSSDDAEERDPLYYENADRQILWVLICATEENACSFDTRTNLPRTSSETWSKTVYKVVYAIDADSASCVGDEQRYYYLAVLIPWLLAFVHSFHLVRVPFKGKSLRDIIMEQMEEEKKVAENEVDYWQPVPWDRKCPRVWAFLPPFWKRLHRPTEPFYTWWRHENYFGWIFYPYRNERLSRWERILIIYAAVLCGFYVVFWINVESEKLVELADTLSNGSTFVKIYIISAVTAPIVKGTCKEIFKLFYRSCRERARETGKASLWNFYTANIAALGLLGLLHGPLVYLLLERSCAYFNVFLEYWLAALLLRLSILGAAGDLVWYLFLSFFGYKDLCPYCTERLRDCECFNDELLLMYVAQLGKKWSLIRKIDLHLARRLPDSHPLNGHPQYRLYTAKQLAERWTILLGKAQNRMTQLRRDILRQEKCRNILEDRKRRCSEESETPSCVSWKEYFYSRWIGRNSKVIADLHRRNQRQIVFFAKVLLVESYCECQRGRKTLPYTGNCT